MEAISRQEHNSPIHLVGDVCLKYEHIADYMNTKRKVLTVNADVARRLAAEEGNEMEGDADAENQVGVAV